MTRIGEKITSVAQMEALPVGAAVTMANRAKLLTRHEDGWAHHADDAQREAAAHWWDGMVLVSVPNPTYDGPMVGDSITTQEQLMALPVASVVSQTTANHQRWQRGGHDEDVNPDLWYDLYNMVWRQPVEVASFPDLAVESLPDTLSGETLGQFAWRFRDLALIGAERANGTAQRAINVLERMECPFKPTVGLRITSQHDRAILPVGTRVYSGQSDDFDSFGLYVKTATGWDTVIAGPRAQDPTTALAVIVDEVEGKTEPDEWLTRKATPTDRQKILMFKAKAWEEGYKEKVANGWCNEFERVMLRGGVTANSVNEVLLNGHKIGDVVTPEQAATLPLGVILSAYSDDGMAFFERVEKATNRAGTRSVEALNFPGHYAERMTIVSAMGPVAGLAKNEHGEYICTSAQFMNVLPIGTVIGYHGAGSDRFIKLAERNGLSWDRLRYFDTADERPSNAGVPQYAPSAFSPEPRCQFVVLRIGPRAV